MAEVVLPCVDSMIHAGGFAALREARTLHVLPVTLFSTLLFRVQRDTPDVIVIAADETSLAQTAGYNERKGIFSEMPAVLLTGRPTAALARAAARMGIHSVLPLEVTTHQLVTAIAATVAGFAVTLPRPSAAPPEAMRTGEELTAREMEVLRLMARGRTNKQLARELKISEHTAKFHVSSVLGKLGAQTRTAAVTIAMTRGLVAI